MLSIFYVGKGKQGRWAKHERDVLAVLARDDPAHVRLASKASRIQEIHDRGDRVGAVRLSAGYVDERDAYQAEALAIDLIGNVLAHANRRPLTNATPGHRAGFIWLRDHYLFVTTEEASVELRDESRVQEILVKGTVEDMVVPGQRIGRPDQLPEVLSGVSARVTPVSLLAADHPAAQLRRGWNPLDPWTDDEARERGRRYWPIARERVRAWLDGTEQMPRTLLLAIPGPSNQTVVRYAWRIAPDLQWEFYPEISRWGVPLGDRDYEHPRLGRALYETRNGRRVQVLAGYAAGVRVLPAVSG